MYMPALFNDSLFDDLFTDITDNKRRPMASPLPGVMNMSSQSSFRATKKRMSMPNLRTVI